MTDTEQVKAAAQAYVYGYPLVYNLTEIAKIPAGGSALRAKTPFNAFGFARDLLDPSAKFVTPNNDTLYMIAACDVSQGPLVLHVPDTDSRYYVLQFVDAWTNNFAYIGRRATGTAEASFLLAKAGYHGEVPAGMQVVEAPSTTFVIVGRIQVNNVDDLPAVHALEDRFGLTPLSVHLGGSVPETSAGVPVPDARVGKDLGWWEQFRVALAAFPPPPADAPYMDVATKLGLTASDSPYVDPDPVLAAVLVDGQRQGEALIEDLQKSAMKIVDGWSSALHVFDYNLDYLGLGTIDSPDWKIADRTTAYVTRAVAARAGLCPTITSSPTRSTGIRSVTAPQGRRPRPTARSPSSCRTAPPAPTRNRTGFPRRRASSGPCCAATSPGTRS